MAANARRRRLMSEINVVPYIDVMLVLLVIFMITAPLLTQGIEVDLPETSSEPLPPNSLEPIVVTVDANGRYYLNIGEKPNTVIDPEPLKLTVAKALKSKPDLAVIVKGDRQVAYGHVVSAMSLLQEAGAPKVGLMTEPAGDVAKK
ncbi:MAG TPA: protein TolR [Gammaproteobacteria bacterium]